MTVQFITLWLAKENHHHEKSNKCHSQQRHNCWSQWNAEFCLCAQHSTKQINTSGIETGIYKQISLYLIMSQQHVINHWEVNCSPPVQKEEFVWSMRQIWLHKINRHHHPNSVRARGSKFHMGQEITGAVITTHHDYLMLPVVYCTAGIITTSI